MKLTGFAGSLSPVSWALFSRDDILIVIFWSKINRYQGQVLQSYISSSDRTIPFHALPVTFSAG
jgi:hypothetical protein